MIALTIFLVLSVVCMVALAYLLGFHLGGDSSLTEVHEVRMRAATAERQLYDLTRSAFVAMAEHAEAHRRNERS